MTTQTKCRIELLGGVRILQHDREISRFRTHKTSALLAYLALQIHTKHAREQLIERFWPDLDPEAGRNNLSTALSSLRSQLEPPGAKGYLLLADRQLVGLNATHISTDVGEFLRTLERVQHTGDARQRSLLLEYALSLYGGDLMPGSYDDWVLTEQRRLRDRYADALRQLAALYEEDEKHDDALELVNRLISVDPFGEQGYQIKMRMLAAQGRTAAALETFSTLKTLLHRELEVSPNKMTLQLAETLRQKSQEAHSESGTHHPLSSPPALSPQPVLLASPSLPSSSKPPLLKTDTAASMRSAPASTNAPDLPYALDMSADRNTKTFLPLQLTRFFGRQQELDSLQIWLRPKESSSANSEEDYMKSSPEPMRLVTLIGPGGAGKTRIALEVATRLTLSYHHRVRFVSLADIPDARLLSFALAHALQLPSSQADPLEQAVEWLRMAPVLLILDNFEHLLREEEPHGKPEHPFGSAAVVWMRLLLERVPTLTCLVTSRRLLGLQGEQELALSSLELPQYATEVTALHQYASVALYVDRAQRAKPDFALTPANAEAVTTLCRRLEGIPLALEMTAAWAKTITPQKMLERMENQLDLLVSRQRDLPARHRSLRATCEWSYDLLAEDLRQFFMRLSVFQGGCTLEAAEAVCSSNAIEQLARLQEQSLVIVQTEADMMRYRLLEPLRAFADEKLKECGDYPKTRARFIDYFLTLGEKMQTEVSGDDAVARLNTLEADFRNIMVALYESLSDGILAPRAWHTALEMRVFFEKRGHSQEALLYLRKVSENTIAQRERNTYSDLISAMGGYCVNLGNYEGAYRYHLECLTIRQSLGDLRRVAATLHNIGITLEALGTLNHDKKRLEEAAGYLQEALELNREMGNTTWEAYNLNGLGIVAKELGDYDLAITYYEQSLALRRAQKDVMSISKVLNNLGTLALLQKNWALAQQNYCQALNLNQEAGDTTALLLNLDNMALLAARQRYFRRTVILMEVCSAVRRRCKIPLKAKEIKEIDEAAVIARQNMTTEAYHEAQSQGAEMSLDMGVEYAISARDQICPQTNQTRFQLPR